MANSSFEGRHYVFLVFLTLLNVMNFVDRQLLASFANFIVPDLGLTQHRVRSAHGPRVHHVLRRHGSVHGHARRHGASAAPRRSGSAAVERVDGHFRRRARIRSLAMPRMFIGVGESILTPTSMSMLADRFPTARLGFAAGFYYMGVPIGVGVSLLIVGYLGPTLGWRNCFYLLGAVGLVLAVVMWFVKETPRRHVLADAARTRPNLRLILATSWQALRESPALRYTILGGVFLHFVHRRRGVRAALVRARTRFRTRRNRAAHRLDRHDRRRARQSVRRHRRRLRCNAAPEWAGRRSCAGSC